MRQNPGIPNTVMTHYYILLVSLARSLSTEVVAGRVQVVAGSSKDVHHLDSWGDLGLTRNYILTVSSHIRHTEDH